MEETYETELFTFLKNNIGNAFSVRALKTILSKILKEIDKKERSNVVLEILENMKKKQLVDSIAHNGEPHYYYLKIFNQEKYRLHKTHYVVPETFISGGKGTKKVKLKYCKNCKKEVILEYRKRKQTTSKSIDVPILEDVVDFFSFLSIFSLENRLARKNTGWFCPNCGNKIAD